MIECRTLGTWELKVDGQAPPSDLTWRKNFALLVYLARSPKRSCTRNHLIGLFWADKPEHDARRSLNVALSTLRQRLGKGSLGTSVDQVRLGPGAVEVDVDRFESLAAAGELAGAADLARGDFLEGFALSDASEFENWLLAERTAVRRRVLDVLTRRATELLDAGDTSEAEALCLRALRLDDLFEPAVRTIMLARTLGGDRAGALSSYAEFKARLGTQLATLPDQETEALAERVRSERTGPLPRTRREHVEQGDRGRRAPLEGRAEALERALTAWRACRAERRRSVIILEGDAGMGKTRLAEEVAARARVDGATTAAIRAVEADLSSPWSGLLSLCHHDLLAAPGIAGASPAALAALRAEPAGSELARALSEVVAAVCHEQPLLLVLDDVQWLDRESLLAVLATLRDPPTPLTILLTASSHPPRTELDEVRARLGREVAGVVLGLGPLSDGAIARLARWAVPTYNEEEVERLTRRVAVDSAGIPLLVTALLEGVAAGLELRKEKEGWPKPGRTLEQTFPGDLPDSVVGAIRVMFGRASDDAQALLMVAGVLGGRTPAARLGRGGELEGNRLAAALDELEWSRWLTAEPRGYAFVARIFRDVIERDMVNPGQRLRIIQRCTDPS